MSGRAESSGSGEGGSEDSIPVGAKDVLSPNPPPETTMGMETFSPRPSPLPGSPKPVPDLPSATVVAGVRPTLVSKHDVRPKTTQFNFDQSVAVPVDGDTSDKSPVHVILVDVHRTNMSGELKQHLKETGCFMD